jgi:hypothetical protein
MSLDNECDRCGKQLDNIHYWDDWLGHVVVDLDSVDLCKQCHEYMIKVVKDAWGYKEE